MASGGHVLPKVSPGPAMPTLLHPLGGLPAAGFYPFGHPTPYAYGLESVPIKECRLFPFHLGQN
jgi:hypothetical protein